MTRDANTLQAELRARALWQDGAAGAGDRSPWPIRVLLGAAAWLAACLFLPLIGLLFAGSLDLTSWSGFAAAGACCAVAVPMLRSGGGDFLKQLGSALSLAGLILACVSAISIEGGGWIGLGILAGAMYGIAPEPAHRFLCASMIAVAFVLAFEHSFESTLSGVPAVVLPVMALCIWAAQLPVAAHPRRQALEQLAWAFFLVGTALALIAGDAWFQDGLRSPDAIRDGIPRVMSALTPALVWWHAGSRAAGPDARSWTIQRVLGCLVLLALAPVWVAIPGAALALCAVLLGFALFRVLLLGMGIAALLAHLAAYYYQTHTTLLQKSIGLFFAGAGLVCVALLVTWWQRRSR